MNFEPPEKKLKRSYEAKRAFNCNWTKDYFFVEHNEKAICLICSASVAGFLKENLERHYKTKHGQSSTAKLEGKQREDKIAKLTSSLIGSSVGTIFRKIHQEGHNITKASFLISAEIARNMKPFSDGEYVKNSIVKFLETTCPEKLELVSKLSLSRNSVQRRIEDLSGEVTKDLSTRIKNFEFFSIALDGSNDIVDTEQLVFYIRGINNDFRVTEELLTVKSMKQNAKGVDIFQEFNKTLIDFSLPVERLVGIATDGAPSMLGRITGFQGNVINWLESINLQKVFWVHCLIHQEALSTKKVGFENIMKLVVKTVIFLRKNGTRHRKFKDFLEHVEAEYADVVYFTEVRWLSRGAVLARFWFLRHEIRVFMSDNGLPVLELQDEKFLMDLAFMVDITEHLSDLNKVLQGKDILVHRLVSTLKSFIKKLKLWIQQLKDQNFAHFSQLGTQKCSRTEDYTTSLEYLLGDFNARFEDVGDLEQPLKIFCSPFEVDIIVAPSDVQLELLDLQESEEPKGKFLSL